MKTSHSSISQPFCFRDRDGKPFKLQNVDLSWDEEDGEVMSCQMSFEIDYETFQKASLGEMFNHEAELRVADFAEDFHDDRPVELEIVLDDDCLDDLLAKSKTVDEAAKCLLALDGTESSLLETENWYLLYVKQSLPLPAELDEEGSSIKIVYRTHWAAEEDDSDREIDSDELFAQLVEFFEDEEWDYELQEERGIVKLSYKGASGEWECYARASDPETEIGFYSIYQENIPESARLKVSEFLTRVNYEMTFGNFEMDLDSGELRYRVCMALGGLIVDPEMLGTNINLNVAIADRFFPFVKKVASGEISVMEAIARSDNSNFIPA